MKKTAKRKIAKHKKDWVRIQKQREDYHITSLAKFLPVIWRDVIWCDMICCVAMCNVILVEAESHFLVWYFTMIANPWTWISCQSPYLFLRGRISAPGPQDFIFTIIIFNFLYIKLAIIPIPTFFTFFIPIFLTDYRIFLFFKWWCRRGEHDLLQSS